MKEVCEAESRFWYVEYEQDAITGLRSLTEQCSLRGL